MNSLRAKCVLAIMIFGKDDEEKQPPLESTAAAATTLCLLALDFYVGTVSVYCTVFSNRVIFST
jgi:hypothetical protein